MAIPAPQSIGYVGTNITFGTVVGLDFTPPGSRRFLWVKNGGGVSTTVTLDVPGTTFEQPNPDVAVVIPAGQERLIGPLVPDLVSASGLVGFLTSPTASVTGAFVDLPLPPPDLP